ncbi:tumor necrosis factor receptor superfamily member 14-like [Alosa pseudoharengus]|uniref:tumor necrosis factor receptor superfamily member 14-like n=1 Tax=Alosa pseudoharengus TaxID=34774 RepID=UPI003F8CBA27
MQMFTERQHKFCLLLLHAVSTVMINACGPAEYEIGQECCPMCGTGHFVKRHCTEFTSTTCLPCPNSTFTDAPNGLLKCLSCSVCDSSVGLRVKRACSSTSDTLCEPLEGHYCNDPIKDGCRGAVEHTKCSPGQYINQTGTAFTDAVCVECVGATYSNGSFTSCRPHTRCESLGLFTWKPGTHTDDAYCEIRRHRMVLWAVLILFCVILVVLLLRCWTKPRMLVAVCCDGA